MHARGTNVLILVPVFVVSMLNVMLETICQLVLVLRVTLEIHLQSGDLDLK